jgi:hypothetical protein
MYHAWEKLRMCIKFLLEHLKGRDHLGDLLKQISEKWGVRMWTVFSWFRTGSMAGFHKYGDELGVL